MNPFAWLFRTHGFTARYHVGVWTPEAIILNTLGDITCAFALLTLCVLLALCCGKPRRSLSQLTIYGLIGCVLFWVAGHLLFVYTGFRPVYNLAAALKLATGAAGWAAVIYLLNNIPLVRQYIAASDLAGALAGEQEKRGELGRDCAAVTRLCELQSESLMAITGLLEKVKGEGETAAPDGVPGP